MPPAAAEWEFIMSVFPLGDKELKIGILGMTEGNGHPYSWSAMFNGFDMALYGGVSLSGDSRIFEEAACPHYWYSRRPHYPYLLYRICTAGDGGAYGKGCKHPSCCR